MIIQDFPKMKPHVRDKTSIRSMVRSLIQNKELIIQMTKRDFVGRYKGSVLGIGWSFFYPLIMLCVYTFVFSVVFKARWGKNVGESNYEFAVILFAGLIVHSLFCDVIIRAPTLMLLNINYIKKVVFPLDILPVIIVLSSLLSNMISLVVLLSALVFLNGFLHLETLLIPLVFAPFILVTLGFAWIIASLGVFLRDIALMTTIITSVMLFLSPIFYPMSALPEKYHIIILVNPLTFIIEQARAVLIFGHMPDWHGLLIYSVVGFLVAWLGYWWFQKTRKAFADVI
jgi:lipopolysaccharide transport system permease protein